VLGKSLLESGAITSRQLDEALSPQQDTGNLLGDILRSKRFVSAEDLSRALAREAGTPFVSSGGLRVDPSAAALVPEPFARRHQLAPLGMKGRSLEVVQANPLDVVSLDELSHLVRLPVVSFCATPEDVREAIEGCYRPRRPPGRVAGRRPRRIAELGLSRKQESQFRALLARERGVIVVTGPDGAGKHTTIESALAWLDTEHRTAFGVGDIHEPSAAAGAMRAAQSGHLVFATLRSPTTVDALVALHSLGLDRHRMASALAGIVAQRVVKAMCGACTSPVSYPSALLDRVGLGQDPGVVLRKGTGCHECGGTGYNGRTGVFEILVFDASLRSAIESAVDLTHLRDVARRAVPRTLIDEALTAALFGRTTIEEVASLVESVS